MTLKQPFQGRKHWKGLLVRPADPALQAWRLELEETGGRGAGNRAGRKPAGDGEDTGARALDFRFDEVREARLVPVVDFKGRGRNGAAAGNSKSKGGANGAPADGGLER